MSVLFLPLARAKDAVETLGKLGFTSDQRARIIAENPSVLLFPIHADSVFGLARSQVSEKLNKLNGSQLSLESRSRRVQAADEAAFHVVPRPHHARRPSA
jgi:hypothetical protein